jgi:hypothetical protein
MHPETATLFLSYARLDANIVHEVYNVLRTTPGITCWYDKQDIVPAKAWDPQIRAGLDSCDGVLLIASRYSLSSQNVKQELDYALTKAKPIYIALIDHTPLDPDIAHCLLVDFRADPLDMKHWRAFITSIREKTLIYSETDV